MKEDIVCATIEVFNNKGLDFTMSELASILKISKKTIYKYFHSKEFLLEYVIKNIFEQNRENEKKVIENEKLSALQKLREVIEFYPDYEINYANLKYLLKSIPKLHDMVIKEFESNWITTFKLFEQCKNEGTIKPIENEIFKTILVGVYDNILLSGKSKEEQKDVLKKCIDIICEGIIT